MAALDTIYLDAIGRDKLLGQPVVANPDEKGDALQVKRTALTDLERDLLRRGLAFYDQFARQNQASPKAAVQTAQAFYRVALLQTAIGDSDDAKSSYQSSITRFQKLTEKHPDRSDYYQQLGEAYAGMSNVLPEWSDAKNALDKSRGAYARAIELDPEKAAYYLARGDIGMRLVDPSSLNDYERAIALDSQNVQLRLRLSRFYRNNTFGSRDRRKAIEHAEKALTLDPSNPECHLQLAAVLGKRTVTIDSNTRQTTESYSNAEQILDHYARAIELAPRQAKGYRERVASTFAQETISGQSQILITSWSSIPKTAQHSPSGQACTSAWDAPMRRLPISRQFSPPIPTTLVSTRPLAWLTSQSKTGPPQLRPTRNIWRGIRRDFTSINAGQWPTPTRTNTSMPSTT